jgi:hypothetical protein
LYHAKKELPVGLHPQNGTRIRVQRRRNPISFGSGLIQMPVLSRERCSLEGRIATNNKHIKHVWCMECVCMHACMHGWRDGGMDRMRVPRTSPHRHDGVEIQRCGKLVHEESNGLHSKFLKQCFSNVCLYVSVCVGSEHSFSVLENKLNAYKMPYENVCLLATYICFTPL